ncbi:MAG TPA: ISAs1 family transposase [Ktedonobacteraceae bacterium]|jgi:hypothetical protein
MDHTTFDDEKQDSQEEEAGEDRSIFLAFENVKDGRKARGKRYPLSFILTLICLGKLAGEKTITGIVEWAREREFWLKKYLNWPKGIPSVATCIHALAQCDAHEVEQAMMHVLAKARKMSQNERNMKNIPLHRQNMYILKQTAIDGKTLCGTQKHPSENQPPVHILSLYECETGIVLGHTVVEKKTNEITGAKAFLEKSFLSGRLFTSDAMHTQKEWFAGIYAHNGACCSIVKRNQKLLYKN